MPHAKGWRMAHHTILAPLPRRRQAQVCRLLALALLPLLLGLGTGTHPDGLPAVPARIACVGAIRRVRWQIPVRHTRSTRWRWRPVCRSLPPALLQASLVGLLLWGNRAVPALLLLVGLPLLRWLLTLSALVWPTWGQGGRCRMLCQTLANLHLAVVLGLGLALVPEQTQVAGWATIVIATRPRAAKPTATGRVLDDRTYEVVLGEQFAIRHKPVDEFDRRMFLLFLRDIHLVERPSKWPFVCQVWLTAWFDTLQELISRWEDYRAAGDWQRLMSRRDGPLIPLEQQQAVIQLWACHLWWTVEEVTTQARAQGLDVCPSRVSQIGQESGLLLARRVVRERFHLEPDRLRPKDEWLVQRVLALLDQLQARLETGERPSVEEQRDLADIQALRRSWDWGAGAI